MPRPTQARFEVCQEAAEQGIPVVNRWSCQFLPAYKTKHGHSSGSRESHKALDGQVRAAGEAFQTIWGNTLRYPGDPLAPAREVINCHCVLVPDVAGAEEPSEDEPVDDSVLEDSTENNLRISEESGIITYGEPVKLSVGAKSRTEPNATNPFTGEHDIDFVSGERPVFPSDHLLGGKGCNKPIRVIDWIVDEYGGEPSEWKHEKAYYKVYDPTGDIREIEIHWFEEPSVGRVEEEIQLRDGRMYRDEWTDADIQGGVRKR